MQNLIFGAFAALEGYREGDAANLGRAVYDRCTVVALCSAKLANPACTVALVTNAPPQEPYRSQLTNAGIEIWDCPFTSYRVPADTNWALAYYKLCAMEWVLANKDFANAAMLDLDTYTQHPLDDLWRECGEAVLMYQVPHAASQGMTAAIGKAYDAVEPQGAPHVLTHFGGELVAGSKARLADFMALCRQYFNQLQTIGLTPREGDEAIWCGAAYRSLLAGQPVRAANAYLFRYWLGGRFYFVSTNYTLDPVCILHLPGAAKDRQLAVLYRRYAKKGQLPAAGESPPALLPARRPSAAAAHPVGAAAGPPVRRIFHAKKEGSVPAVGGRHQNADPPAWAERRRPGADDARHQGRTQRHRPYLHHAGGSGAPTRGAGIVCPAGHAVHRHPQRCPQRQQHPRRVGQPRAWP